MTGEQAPPGAGAVAGSAGQPPSPLADWTPQALDALRAGLPPMAEAGPPAAELARFCSDYGLDPERGRDGVEHRVGWLASGEYRLAVHRWTLAGATGNLLLVHGFLSSRAQWLLNLDALAKGCTPVTVELFGHHNSPTPTDPACYSPEYYLQAFEAIRTAIGVERSPGFEVGPSTHITSPSVGHRTASMSSINPVAT